MHFKATAFVETWAFVSLSAEFINLSFVSFGLSDSQTLWFSDSPYRTLRLSDPLTLRLSKSLWFIIDKCKIVKNSDSRSTNEKGLVSNSGLSIILKSRTRWTYLLYLFVVSVHTFWRVWQGLHLELVSSALMDYILHSTPVEYKVAVSVWRSVPWSWDLSGNWFMNPSASFKGIKWCLNVFILRQ